MLTNWAIRRNLEEIIRSKEQSTILNKEVTISVGDLFQVGKQIDNQYLQIEKQYIEKMKAYLKGVKEIFIMEDYFECDFIVELICEDPKDTIHFVYFEDGIVEGHDDKEDLKKLVSELMNEYLQKNLKLRMVVESISRNYLIRLNVRGMEIKLFNSIFEYLNKDLKLVIPYRDELSKKVVKSKYGNTSLTTNIPKVSRMLKNKQANKRTIDAFLDHLQVYEKDLPEKMQEEVRVFKKKLD